VFFSFFVALQPFGAAVGRKWGMSRWVPFSMALWGVCTALHAWINSKWQLIVLRAIIGILEGKYLSLLQTVVFLTPYLAGFYPTTVAYLSLFYTRYEFARRLGMFYGQYAIAGAFGGILSYFVFTKFPHVSSPPEGSLRSWQVLFLLEGGATIILALIGFLWLPHNAKTAWFLSPDERAWAEKRIQIDQQSATLSRACIRASIGDEDDVENEGSGEHTEEAHGLLSQNSDYGLKRQPDKPPTDDRGLSVEDIAEAALDWKLCHLLACNILSAIPVTAFSLFLPIVLKPLTRTPAYANLLTAPPYLFGAVVLYGFSFWSDRSRQRINPILWSLGLLIFGLTAVVVIPPSLSLLRYLALCVLLSGTFVASPLTIAWFSGNIPETGKRSIVLGINGWGEFSKSASNNKYTHTTLRKRCWRNIVTCVPTKVWSNIPNSVLHNSSLGNRFICWLCGLSTTDFS